MIKVSDMVRIEGLDEKKSKSIYELSKNKYVKDFLKKNNLPEKCLNDYWIEFLDYSEDKKCCENCLGLEYCPKENIGMIKDLIKQDDINLVMSNCHFYSSSQEIINKFKLKNVKDEILLTDLEQWVITKKLENGHLTELEQFAYIEIMKYIKDPKDYGLFIHSENYKSDKTLLMAAMMNSLAKKGNDIAFIHFPTYLVDLKASFQNEKSIDWTELMDIPYLVLDGIGEENVTPYSRDEILLTILSYRLLNRLPTFFTSFYGFKDLQKVYTIKKGDEIKAKTLILKMKALCKEITLDE